MRLGSRNEKDFSFGPAESGTAVRETRGNTDWTNTYALGGNARVRGNNYQKQGRHSNTKPQDLKGSLKGPAGKECRQKRAEGWALTSRYFQPKHCKV